jgi:hypothetical protein
LNCVVNVQIVVVDQQNVLLICAQIVDVLFQQVVVLARHLDACDEFEMRGESNGISAHSRGRVCYRHIAIPHELYHVVQDLIRFAWFCDAEMSLVVQFEPTEINTHFLTDLRFLW